MSDPAGYRRTAAALALVASPVLAVGSRFLYQPKGGNDPAVLLAALHQAHGRALVSGLLFTLQTLPFMIAALGIGHLLRERAPRLSSIGATVAVLGGFADAVASTFTLAYAQLAQDVAHRDAYVAVIKQTTKIEGLFGIVGALGTVIGLLLLSIGLFRSRTGPRWVAPLIWVFIVLEFAGSGIAPSIGLASVTVLLIAYWALALTVWQSPRDSWATLAPSPLAEPSYTAASA